MTHESTPQTCAQCGSTIPPDAPGGQCPKCLLGAAATFTDPATPPPAPAGWPTLDEVRAAFPELAVEGEIGRGGMAVVYKARQLHLDRPVALKVLAPWLAADPDFSARFSREAKTLARLNHPCIVTIHDFGQSAGFYWLLMEYVDGVNLRQAMQAGRFTPEQALGIVPKVCEALAYAHSHGVLHRDIKPDNILLDSRGHVKLADFGIAKLAGAPEHPHTLTMTGMHLGTPAYMAPEQVEKPADVDHRADIYSLGVVFYEMLTGELPLGRFAPPSEKATVDARIDEIVLRTLEKERERRYQTADEVKTRVQSVGSEPPPPPPPPAAATSAPNAGAAPVAVVETVSRKATPAAAFTAMSLLLVLVAGFLAALALDRGRHSNPPSVFLFLTAAVPGLLALGCAGAGIFLGATALGDIRRSGGRMAGAGFATFASLAWLLVIILGVGLFAGAALGEGLFERRFRPSPGGWLMALTLAACAIGAVWIDVVLVRKTLRWARGDGQAIPPATPPGATLVSSPSANAVVRHSGLAIAGGVITFLTLLLNVFTVPVIVYFASSGGSRSPGFVEGPLTMRPAFGPWELLIGSCSGLFLPLVGTLLGLFGMNAVRTSGGRLKGAGWAVFGGMTWPALASAGVVYTLLMLLGALGARLMPVGVQRLAIVALMLLGLGAAIATLVFIFRRAHRWVTTPPDGAKSMTPWLVAGAVAVLLLAPVTMVALGLLVPALTLTRVEHSGPDVEVVSLPGGGRPLFGASDDTATIVITESRGTNELRDGQPEVHRILSINYQATVPPFHEVFLEIRRDHPGGTASTVERVEQSALRIGPQAGAPSVTVHRFFDWELPEATTTDDTLDQARRQINRTWLHRPVRIEPGKPAPVFTTPLPDGSTLTAAFILRPLPPSR